MKKYFFTFLLACLCGAQKLSAAETLLHAAQEEFAEESTLTLMDLAEAAERAKHEEDSYHFYGISEAPNFSDYPGFPGQSLELYVQGSQESYDNSKRTILYGTCPPTPTPKG